jgi:hypothetical protein
MVRAGRVDGLFPNDAQLGIFMLCVVLYVRWCPLHPTTALNAVVVVGICIDVIYLSHGGFLWGMYGCSATLGGRNPCCVHCHAVQRGGCPETRAETLFCL